MCIECFRPTWNTFWIFCAHIQYCFSVLGWNQILFEGFTKQILFEAFVYKYETFRIALCRNSIDLECFGPKSNRSQIFWDKMTYFSNVLGQNEKHMHFE